MPSGVVLLGLELDFGFQPLLALVVLEHAGQGAVGGVVVHVRADSQMRMAAEFLHAHSGVAGDLDLADARLRSGVHLEGNIDELLLRVLESASWVMRRLVESIVGQRLAHLLSAWSSLAWVNRVPGVELAGALQLRIDGCALGAIHADPSDKGAGSSAEYRSRHPVMREPCT